MKYMLISSILYLIHFTSALEVTVLKQINCKQFSLWEISQSVHYNMAYDWTHHKKIKNWKFSCDNESTCCTSSYLTHVQVPQFIHNYIYKSLSTNIISKETCMRKNNFVEYITISNVPIIDTLHVTCTVEPQNKNTVDVTMHTIFDVPWYLYPLESLIQRHVSKSFKEYINIVHKHLCDGGVD